MYTDTAYTLRQYDDEPMDLEGNGGNELAEAFHQGCIDAWLRAGLRLRRPSFADFFGKFRRDDDDDDTYFMIAYWGSCAMPTLQCYNAVVIDGFWDSFWFFLFVLFFWENPLELKAQSLGEKPGSAGVLRFPQSDDNSMSQARGSIQDLRVWCQGPMRCENPVQARYQLAQGCLASRTSQVTYIPRPSDISVRNKCCFVKL